jgi:predicted TIM-barrel fold metal-dependent hydrolase
VVVREFPETPIVMVHMGDASTTRENASRAVIDVAKLCPNMMAGGQRH